jgi:hypothetical protein
MAGAGILPLITAPIIANMRLHHVLIDGGARLNVISHVAFKQLQISGSRLGPSRLWCLHREVVRIPGFALWH